MEWAVRRKEREAWAHRRRNECPYFSPTSFHSQTKTPPMARNWRKVREVRRTLGGALLDPDDMVSDVLRDSEFVIVGNRFHTLNNQQEMRGRELLVLKRELDASAAHPIVGTTKVIHAPEDSLFSVYTEPEHFVAPEDTLVLNGYDLTTADLVKCGRGLFRIELAEDACERIQRSRQMLEDIVAENKVVYGITTGFGNFANVHVGADKLVELQQNLIRSHACGVGPPLPPSRARMLLALRLNVLSKGYAGISLPVVQTMAKAFNAFCVSWIPEKGTVGCSGDLAPLAHLALGLMGEGQMWSPETGWDEAAKVLQVHNITPVKLGPKEGIALINGTQMVSALGSEAIERAGMVARQADVIAALTLDVLKGTTKAYDHDIHKLRPHPGQMRTAERLRALLHSDKNPSQIAGSLSYDHDIHKLRPHPGQMRTAERLRALLHSDKNPSQIAGSLSLTIMTSTNSGLTLAKCGRRNAFVLFCTPTRTPLRSPVPSLLRS